MAWLFERMIELAAWVAFMLGLACIIDSIYVLVQVFRAWRAGDPTGDLLFSCGQSAGGFVLFALAMGALACIDRYVFDLPEQQSTK